MQHAWENVVKLQLSVERVESNPQLVQIIPPNEVVVLISFELIVGETRGMLNLCIPFNSIERISNKLTSNSWVSYSKRPPTAEIDPQSEPPPGGGAGGADRRTGPNQDHD